MQYDNARLAVSPQQASLAQVFGDEWVGLLDEFAGEGISARHLPLQIYRVDKIQVIILTGLIVNLTVGRGNMYYPSSFFHRNKITLYHWII